MISACITATDPVLAQPIVGKGNFAKRVPAHLRNLLSAESGCNDGVSVPFVYLALNLIIHAGNPNEIAKDWICVTVLYECGLGLIFGSCIGYFGRVAIKFAKKRKIVDYESSLAFYIMIALLCAGFGSILGLDDLLASFAAGTAFNWDGSATEENEESPVSTVIDILLNMAYFVYLGSIIPWPQFNDASIGLPVWRLIILAIVVIFLRRIPAVLVMKVINPDIKDWKEALFVGHFGPIGVGAVFASILAIGDLEAHALHLSAGPSNTYPLGTEYSQLIQVIWPTVCFLIVTSIIVHGSSVAVLTLGKHLQTMTFTYTYTLQKTGDTDGGGGITGGKKWLNRLPRLERTGTSFSFKRVGTQYTDEEEDEEFEYLMSGNEKDKINSQLNARIGISEKNDEDIVAHTTGVPVRPAGGAKRKQNRSKLKKLKKKKNGETRQRPALETLDLKTMSRHNTEFTNNEEDEEEGDHFTLPEPASPHMEMQASSTSDDKYMEDYNNYEDMQNDAPLSLVASNDGRSLKSENRSIPVIRGDPSVLQSMNDMFDLKPSDLEPVVDEDGQVRIPTKGYKYNDKLVIEDQLGEVLKTVPSNASPPASFNLNRVRSNTVKSIASALGVLKAEPGLLKPPVSDAESAEVKDHISIDSMSHNNEIEVPGPSPVRSPPSDHIREPEKVRTNTVGSVKRMLPRIKNIGEKLQPSDDTIEKGLTGLVMPKKAQTKIECEKAKSKKGRVKFHGFKKGEEVLIEDDSGEVVGRWRWNPKTETEAPSEKPAPQQQTPSGILHFVRPRGATVSAKDLEKQNKEEGHFVADSRFGETHKLNDYIHGMSFEDKIKHFIKADRREAIVKLPEHLQNRSRTSIPVYSTDSNDDEEEEDDSQYDSEAHDAEGNEDFDPTNTNTNETFFERQRRLGALHKSERLSDDEEEEPETKY